MLQQQWPWLTPSGRPPSMSAASHHLISYTLLLYLTSKIVTPCWCTLVIIFFCFKRKEKCVKLCGNSEMSFFCPSNTDLAIVFFLTREIVGYYILSWWLWSLIYSLYKVPSCLPLCAWKEWWQYDLMEEDAMKTMISGVCVMLQCWMFLSFCPWEIHEKCMFVYVRVSCVCMCVRLLAFEHFSAPVREVNRY